MSVSGSTVIAGADTNGHSPNSPSSPHSPSEHDVLMECYQDRKVPGDFARYLHHSPAKCQRVLQDTQEHVYHFKRTIIKKNKFGKACRCGVWLCKEYRRLHCCCAVYTFGDTIIGSTGPHNHYPADKDPTSKGEVKSTRDQPNRLGVSRDFRIQVKQHNHRPKAESAKRSVERAREQISRKRKKKHRDVKKLVISGKNCVEKEESRGQARETAENCCENGDISQNGSCPTDKIPPNNEKTDNVKSENGFVNGDKCSSCKTEIKEGIKEETKLLKSEETMESANTPSLPLETSANSGADAVTIENGVASSVDNKNCALEGDSKADAEPRKDTLNEILEVLTDLSTNSSHSYQLMCSQLLSEYLTGQTVSELAACQPAQSVASPVKTISSFTVPIQEIPVASSPTLVVSSSPSSPTFTSTTDSDMKLVSIAPKVTTRASRPFVKPTPPPNVTISYFKDEKPTTTSSASVNPDLRPVINLPNLDTPARTTPPPLVTPLTDTSLVTPVSAVMSSLLPMTTSVPMVTTIGNGGSTTHHVSGGRGPELPSRTEFDILSDMTSLESLLDILKENSPIQDFAGMRCTCKTMLRCNLHDIGPGKKRQSDARPRRVISRNDEVPKPARKKYCYRGSKKPYKFIPETFRDCHLPANEETVIGSAEKPVAAPAPSTSKRGRGGRRSRMSKPVTVPTPSPPVAPPSAIAPPPPPAVSVPGLTPISPATHHDTRVSSASTINLVPVTSMSTPTFENSKLLKAVPIGNGLYRLEETNESEMAGGALSKPLFTTDIAPNSNIVAPANLQLGSNIPLTNSFNQRPSKPMSVIEHHPVDTRKSPAPASVTTSSDQSSQLTSLLSSVITNMKSDSVPLMIPATSQNTVSHASNSNPIDLITTQPTISNSNSGLSSSLVTQILERLLSPESSSSPEDQRILEALSSSSLAGISTHH